MPVRRIFAWNRTSPRFVYFSMIVPIPVILNVDAQVLGAVLLRSSVRIVCARCRRLDSLGHRCPARPRLPLPLVQ